jgi:hypothetical protein
MGRLNTADRKIASRTLKRLATQLAGIDHELWVVINQDTEGLTPKELEFLEKRRLEVNTLMRQLQRVCERTAGIS